MLNWKTGSPAPTRRQHGIVVLLAALLMSAVGPPSTLGFTGIVETGTRGHWEVTDNPFIGQEGARCVFVQGPLGSELQRIKVRAPTVINGVRASMTWVGWRFKLLHSTDGVNYTVFYKSPVWKDRASATVAADGFQSEMWYRRRRLTVEAQVKVQLTILFYAPGSMSQVEGKVVGTYENYVEKVGTALALTPLCVTIEA